MRKLRLHLIAVFIVGVVTMNLLISSVIYRFKNQKKTETEILMNIGNIFIWNF